MKNLSDTNVGTVRTAVNATWLTGVVTLVAAVTGWDIEVADLLPYLPVILVVGGVFYRASRALGDRFPALGHILFGILKKPVYVEPPATVTVDSPGEPTETTIVH